MNIRPIKDLTPLEIWFLNVVYEMGEGDIHQILDRVRSEKDWKYTTVMTIASRLCEKGYLKRIKQSRRYVYMPNFSRRQLFKNIMDYLFGDSMLVDPSPLVSYMGNIKKLSQREKQELKTIIDSLEEED
jgi:predicted transcriptional regulator